MSERLGVLSRQIGVFKEGDVDLSLTNIHVTEDGTVGIVFLNRVKELNALSDALVASMNNALKTLEADPKINVIILTGNGRAFAAGADIKEMADKTVSDMVRKDKIAPWEEVLPKLRKPVIAAVNGAALGGGCEIAMMCDIILASDKALFGQPEIKLGLLPGAGGSQRLTRAVGKSVGMQMCLTGEPLKPERLHQLGLVSEIVPHDDLLPRALEVARQIARHSQPVAMITKEAVGKAFETSLAEGVRAERRLFHIAFGLEDAREGMYAFMEKRKADFKGK